LMKWLRWLIRYFCRLPNLWMVEGEEGGQDGDLQYSRMTRSSQLLRLPVQAPSRLTMFRCLGSSGVRG
jgi:hypothetical protein